MKIIGRLLLVASMLASVGLVSGAGIASAGTSDVAFPQHSCTTTINGTINVSADYDIDVTVSADDSVESGNSANYAVTVTGLTNSGFADFNGGKALVRLDIGGTEIDSPTVDLADVPKNGTIVIPEIVGMTDPLTETTEISVVRVRYWNTVASSRCNFAADSRASVAVLVNDGGTGLPATTTSVTVTPQPIVYGTTASITATVGTDGSTVSTGTVEFRDGVGAAAPSLGTAPVTAGSASISGVALGAGSHSIVASYSGTDALAGSQGVNTFTVDKANQTIEFAALPAATEGDGPLSLTATATSGLPVGFAAVGACTVDGATLTLVGAGSCQVTASQPGDANHLAATDVVQSFEIAASTDPGDGNGGGDNGGGDNGGDGGQTAVQKSITAAVPYRCVISFPSLETDLISNQTLTVKLTAPDRATIGSTYSVYMDVAPGISTDAEIPAGAIQGMKTRINVAAPGKPAELVTDQPTNASAIPSGGVVAVPRSTGKVTAGGNEGDLVKITPGVILVPTKAQTPGAQGGSVTCTPSGNASISTRMTETQVTQDNTAPTPPPATPAQPAAPSAATPTATPAAPVPTGSGSGAAAVQAQVIEQSAQVTFECKIYAGSNLITTQKDTQTVTVRTVDKVAPGGTLAFQMTLAPGPVTGPVALPNGVQNVSVGAAVGGAGSPSLVTMNVGTLPEAVGTNSNVKIPTVSGSVNVTGGAGEQITITAADMRFETTRPPSRTECTALDAPVITTTDVVEGVEVAAETAARLASTGNGREWLVPLAVVQLLLGVGLLTVVERRRASSGAGNS